MFNHYSNYIFNQANQSVDWLFYLLILLEINLIKYLIGTLFDNKKRYQLLKSISGINI